MTGSDLKSATLILRVLTREGDDAALAAIAEELTLADAYRDAQCVGRWSVSAHNAWIEGDGRGPAPNCVGESHSVNCPVELAKQEWWAAQDKRRSL